MEEPVFEDRLVIRLLLRPAGHECDVAESCEACQAEEYCRGFGVWPWSAEYCGDQKCSTEMNHCRCGEGADRVSVADLLLLLNFGDQRDHDKLQSGERSGR